MTLRRFVALVLGLLAGLFLSPACAAPVEAALQTGDLVFQTSRSSQSQAIQLATGSPWSHVGLVEVTRAGVVVIEAVQPVSVIPFARWRARGVDGKVLVRRLPELDEARAKRAIAVARLFLGRPYDAKFGWSDDRIYCSELVYKAFERGAGIRLGHLEKLGDLRLGGVMAALRGRYGKELALDLELVTPASLAADRRLVTVQE